MEKKYKLDLSSAGLHILAMALMLCDHLWATIIPGNVWLTCIGRIAFPIFAFMIVEGYHHTSNLRRYVLRLLMLAILSEIPYNLMYGSNAFYPIQQNVIWTFLLGLLGIYLNEKAKKKGKIWLRLLTAALSLFFGYWIGQLSMVDYHGMGYLTVMAFYFLRGRKWWQLILQLAALWWLNAELIKGLFFEVEIFGHMMELKQQALAALAFIPIVLYNGRQGYHSKWFKWFCYYFYPVHILILYLITLYI